MMILRPFSRRWWKTTLLVILAMGVMARLGIWQLDRLAQRRAFNARVEAQLDAPPLILTENTFGLDLTAMEYRSVAVEGEYDPGQQIVLRNQAWVNRYGVHLLTPLRIKDSDTAVLVDRGWVPGEDFESGTLDQYNEPGVVEVQGMLRDSQTRPDFGRRADPTLAPGEQRLDAWYLVNLDRIAEQIPYPLLPVYIQQAPDPAWTDLPYRSLPELELTEGPHLGYALQWFAFALILGVGYLYFIRKEESNAESAQALKARPSKKMAKANPKG